MFPMKPLTRISSNKIRDAFHGDAVFLGDISVTHSYNVVLEQGNYACISNNHIAGPSFLGAINHVVRPSARRQVLGVYASWIVARMHDMHSYRNFSIRSLIRKSMGKLFWGDATGSEKSVTFVVFVGLPIPALVFGFYGNLGPKSFFKHELNMLGYPSKVNRQV